MYWTSITRLLHHLRTEKARLTIWLFTSGITFLLLYFFWEPKVRSFPKELVRIERMADTLPAAALQELERYDTTKCMPGAITYYHFIALKTRYQLQPAYRIAHAELTKLVIDLEYLDPTPAQQADLYYYAGNMALRGNDITQSQGISSRHWRSTSGTATHRWWSGATNRWSASWKNERPLRPLNGRWTTPTAITL